MKKTAVEIQLVRAELTGVPEKRLLKSRNLGCVDLIWPRTGIAKKSVAREMVFKKGRVDFSGEEWTKRVLFREEIEGRCGLAVTITEPVSVQLARRFLRLTAKYALKMGASPIDALAQMLGEKDTPKAIAQGVVDVADLPSGGEERTVEISLKRPLTGKTVGALTLLLRA